MKKQKKNPREIKAWAVMKRGKLTKVGCHIALSQFMIIRTLLKGKHDFAKSSSNPYQNN